MFIVYSMYCTLRFSFIFTSSFVFIVVCHHLIRWWHQKCGMHEMSISAFLFERFAGLLFDRHTDPNDHYRNVCYRQNTSKKIDTITWWGASEGMGFPKSRIRVSAGNSDPVRPLVRARPVVTQGVSEGMGFPKSRIRVSAGPSAPVRLSALARGGLIVGHRVSLSKKLVFKFTIITFRQRC